MMPPRHHDRVRAEPLRLRHWLGRVTAEFPSLIRRRSDNAAQPIVSDQHALAAQLWMIKLLDRREEGVHVNVKDAAAHGQDCIDCCLARAAPVTKII